MKTAKQIYVRLTEMEKIDLRRASPDRVHYLSQTSYQAECGRDSKIMAEVKTMCDAEIGAMDAQDSWWFKPTWKF